MRASVAGAVTAAVLTTTVFAPTAAFGLVLSLLIVTRVLVARQPPHR